MSIAGGYHRAVQRASACGCQCVQLFTKSNAQWRAKEISPAEAAQFQNSLEAFAIAHPLVHDSYLINLASPEGDLWRRSVDAFATELRRADTLGIPYVVTHPGCHTTVSPEKGIAQVIRGLDLIHDQTRGGRAQCLLETTAGQGSALGWRFEQLAAILDGVREPDRVGVCFDTCHVFAAGYSMGTAKDYRKTMRVFAKTIGLGRIRAFHLNDSARSLGSRLDRHAHIGRGEMGLDPFRNLLNDPRFQDTPMYLETPKEEDGGVDMDIVNLAVLRNLVSTGQ
jgi:deoxyribonuclease-4